MSIERQIEETNGLCGALAKRIAAGGPVHEIAIYERHAERLLRLIRRKGKRS